MSLADYLQREMDARGWSRRKLSERSQVSWGSLANIWQEPDAVPDLETLEKLAVCLDVPLWRVVEAAGFNLGMPTTPDALERRTAQLLASAPQFRALAPYLEHLEPDDLRAVLAYIDGLMDAAKRGRSPAPAPDAAPGNRGGW